MKVEVFWANFEKYSKFQPQALTYLSESELSRYKKMKSQSRQREFILTRYLVKSVLAEKLGKEKKQIDIVLERKGKPALTDRNLEFNYAHSKDLFVIAVGSKPLGVDIEYRDSGRNIQSLKQKVLSERETEELEKSNDINFFFDCWTYKEAILKCAGVGIVDDLKNICKIQKKGFENKDYTVQNLEVIKDFSLAVAVPGQFEFFIEATELNPSTGLCSDI